MLTRFEVDGFKNLLGVSVELGPFTCVAGPNGVGKSNLFDAIRFLSLLADRKLMDAARHVRGTDEDPTDPRELFGRGSLEPTMRFAAEMILPPEVVDDFGRRARPTITFVRYELILAYLAPTAGERTGRLQIRHEELTHINLGDAHKHLRWPHRAHAFRNAVVTGRRSGGPFISTVPDEDGAVVIRTHQDGGSRGKPRPSPAHAAVATVIGATNAVDDPTIFAVKQEMLGWRHFALEPAAIRRPDKYWEGREHPSVSENGAHLPATLWSLGADDAERAEVFALVANQLSDLVPVGGIRVRPNDANRQYELEVRELDGTWLGARALSEGMLRFLALGVIAADPNSVRLLCMEEPENGIHPSRLPAMLELLDTIAVDPTRAPDADNPLRQVLVNTHSPGVVQLLEGAGRAADLLVAESVVVSSERGPTRTLRFRHRRGTWRDDDLTPGVGPGIAAAYLTTAVGAQLPLAVADG
ncbi:MAG: AAA family ATPase [Myxococcota bacterium]